MGTRLPIGVAMSKKAAVYTVIIDGKDALQPPPAAADCDFFVITNSSGLNAPGYHALFVDTVYADPVRNARIYKILSHEVFGDYEASLFVDGNIRITTPSVAAMFDAYLSDCDLAIHAHEERNCIYAEAEACLRWRKDNPACIHSQMAAYRRDGYPENNGLVTSNILFRRHTPAVRRFNILWWNEICKFSRRDQLSFNYVAWKTGLRYNVLPGNAFRHTAVNFRMVKHRRGDRRDWHPADVKVAPSGPPSRER